MNEEIQKYFNANPDIEFALLFGSHASKRNSGFSDLDIGIYLKNSDYDLLKIGRLITDLNSITNKRIDLQILNDLYKRSPKLSFEICKNHTLIYSKSDESYIDFKTRSQIYYFDTEMLRSKADEIFNTRLEQKKFGS